jgi:hypothetical protein
MTRSLARPPPPCCREQVPVSSGGRALPTEVFL